MCVFAQVLLEVLLRSVAYVCVEVSLSLPENIAQRYGFRIVAWLKDVAIRGVA